MTNRDTTVHCTHTTDGSVCDACLDSSTTITASNFAENWADYDRLSCKVSYQSQPVSRGWSLPDGKVRLECGAIIEVLVNDDDLLDVVWLTPAPELPPLPAEWRFNAEDQNYEYLCKPKGYPAFWYPGALILSDGSLSISYHWNVSEFPTLQAILAHAAALAEQGKG